MAVRRKCTSSSRATNTASITIQINIEGDPLMRDDFAYAIREELIAHVIDKTGGKALSLKSDAYKENPACRGQGQPALQSAACIRRGLRLVGHASAAVL